MIMATKASVVILISCMIVEKIQSDGIKPVVDMEKSEENNRHKELILDIVEDINWPDASVPLGQVSGVTLDRLGRVYVLHRGDRIWSYDTFDMNNVYLQRHLGSISTPVVFVIHPKTGKILRQWGSNRFYMPHGITIDHEDNVWITDVALHQVFKFPPLFNSSHTSMDPLLTLGTAFLPGKNASLFCKPTSVVVLRSGEFFVADGYCNSRIIKYAPDGTVLLTWGRRMPPGPDYSKKPYFFYVPHDLTYVDDKNLVCVSDRENGRIQCFDALNGTFVYQIKSDAVGGRIFSASYTPVSGGLFFVVNGPEINTNDAHGSVLNCETRELLTKFQPSNDTFQNPHDIFVSPDGREVYVAELQPARVKKFNVGGLREGNSTKVAAQIPEELPSYSAIVQSLDVDKSSGTMLMAMLITAAILCFGATLLAAVLLYTKSRSQGCSGQCRNPKWSKRRSSADRFMFSNFLGQQRQGFVKLSNYEESEDEEEPVNAAYA